MTFVTGPASAVDTSVALFDGTTGSLIKGASVQIDASGNFSGNAAGATTLAITEDTSSSITRYLDFSSGGGGYSGVSYNPNFSVVVSTGVLSAPIFSGASITQSPGDNSTKIATTAYVDAAVAAGGGKAPTIQYLTSGSSATYTRPAGCTAIQLRMAGAGGGGGGSTGAGGTGGDSVFNSIHAAGGLGGAIGGNSINVGGLGGSGGTGTASLRIAGGGGGTGMSNSANNTMSSSGGSSAFGGGASGVANTTNGNPGATNSGGGGGGGMHSDASGGGGGAGEYVEIYIATPASTYTYTVGSGGSGGTGTNPGGAGGSGVIIVTEYY